MTLQRNGLLPFCLETENGHLFTVGKFEVAVNMLVLCISTILLVWLFVYISGVFHVE